MNKLDSDCDSPGSRERSLVIARLIVCFLTVCALMGFSLEGRAQVAPSAFDRSASIAAGGTFSAFHEQYGSANILGGTAFADLNVSYHYGIEAEATWLTLRQPNDEHAETYLIGPRYTFRSFRRWRPYAKALVGNGQFNFPFNYAHGGYLVVGGGGGVDYRLSHRLYWRVADVEYQDWPQFTFGSQSSVGVSSGIQFRIR